MLSLLLLSGLLTGCAAKTGTPGASASADTLTALFLKVGKADAIVLTAGSETLVIDAGETDDGDELLGALHNAGVQTVDTLVITHFDKDHVGGAAALIDGIPVETVLLPDYEGESEEYAAFAAAMAENGIEPQRLTESLTFTLGDASVRVDPPADTAAAGSSDDADNDLSLITTVTHGSVKLLFTGDAENDRLEEWLSSGAASRVTLLKMPHHGVYCKRLKDLVAAVSPSYAVICDSEKNPAEDKTLELLEAANVTVFETKTAAVKAVSDGATLQVSES